MNEKVLHTLEYEKIIGMLTEKCQTPLGKAMAETLVPMSDPAEIEKAQEETSDALSRIFRFGSCSCSGTRDIRESLIRLKVQSNLGMVELLNIGMLLKTAGRVKSYGAHNDAADTHDSLENYFLSLEPVTPFQREIERCIISEEEMADDASPALRSIRRKIHAMQDKIHTELNALVVSSGNLLRDTRVTMRNGRYCLPVKTEFRGQINGMIHDESSTGSTVFVEPASVVKLNNEIRMLEAEEAKEIEIILANLSAEAETHLHELTVDLNVLSHLDFVFGKASLARDMDATRPLFNDRRYIEIHQGRHPLLDRNRVVPIDLSIGDTFHTLIVTGPNTGGKTVSLKTVGLFQLMGQAGLHIPARDESKLGIFTEVFADIGDEQSIEQNLSTFSSHMKNITRILDQADTDSLVLLDELCAGTDPTEGAALAIAILNFLHRMEVRTLATTHYAELKVYALSTPGVMNASCEFDVATLSPTYRLLIGIPGKSNAFAISKKLGLPGFIIDEAKGQMDSTAVSFEDVIKNLNDSQRKLQIEKSNIGRLKAEAKRLNETLEKEKARVEAEKAQILMKAREEARTILQDAKNQVDETIRAMNRSGKDVRELENARTKTRELLNKNTPVKTKAEKKSHTSREELHLGDAVLVLSMGLKGTVSALPDKNGNLFVQMGIMRSQVHLSDVQLLEEETVKVDNKPVSGGFHISNAATISAEINLIGKTVDEALSELDKYLDDAFLSHLPSVRIVHGKGSGILRKAVQDHLRRLSFVKSFHLGEYGEGDTGVTIAEFK